ncbi:hypothetical protein D9599_09590 [Roseomonas sp. KE2513]|uniref:hypothetical protein n=1 Tax=Roseomonas sp. KE2513 TaxID=2479202 RepID=UPI0018DFA03C|nr:hypothetical protein [Roseomonas sp. KE2513]MBI0535825.1 hypothetical protein [Roseomonas sp. KE2513]
MSPSANPSRRASRSIQPRFLPPVHSAALMQDPAGLTLQLQGDCGAMTQVPLTLAALREIAALAGSALSERAPPAHVAEAQSTRVPQGMAEAGAGGMSR